MGASLLATGTFRVASKLAPTGDSPTKTTSSSPSNSDLLHKGYGVGKECTAFTHSATG